MWLEGGGGLTSGIPAWLCLVYPIDPTFMLGIWHEGDWLKERFGLAQSMVRLYVEVSDLVDTMRMLYYVLFILEINEHKYWLLCLFYDCFVMDSL